MNHRIDGGDESAWTAPSLAVVEAVAEAEGVHPKDLCPPEYESLYAVIDPDALDKLFALGADGTPRSSGSVSFPFCGYHVVVDHRGAVTLEHVRTSSE
jgi:hypothetical protein